MRKQNQTAPAVNPATESARALAVILSALSESMESNRELMRFVADPETVADLETERADLLAARAWAEKQKGVSK